MLGVTPSAARPLCGRAAASCAVERSIFAVSLAFYHKATLSVALRSTAPPNPPPKNTTSFLGTPGEEPRRLTFAVLPKSLSRAGFPALRRSGANFASRFVPRGFASMLAFSRGRGPRSVREWHAPCAIPKLESGQSPTGALPRKRFLALFPKNSLRDFCGSPFL